MKDLTFSKLSMSLTALALLAVFGLAGCGKPDAESTGSAGGVDGGGGTTGGGSSTTTTVQGNLAVASGDNATQYTVFNSNQSSTPSSAGSFSTSVLKESPTYTYAISDTGNKVYAAVGTNAEGSMTINAQSTAEAMVLLNPLLIPRTSDERTKIINIVKADAAVKTLAAVIESVYGSVDDPMSDSRISNALTDAVKSALTSWQASNISSANALRQTPRKSFALAYATGASGSSSLQIYPTPTGNDMGALTLANSAGATLKLELNDVGVGGNLTTNVDWVVRIVELDPAKIQWTKSGVAQWGNPTDTDIDSLIKTGGYDQKTIIEGAVGSGLLKLAVDPIGLAADSINAQVFPADGINLPHDGVYAIIALSGSPFGDSTEYNSVKNSAWQRSLYAEAAGINMISAAIDVVGVGTTFANAAGPEIPDISLLLAVELGVIKTELTANPDYLGTASTATATAYFVGKTGDIGAKLLDFLRPHINSLSSLSDQKFLGWKNFIHKAVELPMSLLDVWSGTVTVGTRVGNYLFNVTPRESGYAVLGTFPGQQADTTPPSVPTGVSATAASVSQINLTWSASTDDVGVTGYKIYRGGTYLKSASTTTSSDTGLSASTQYCYTFSAYDAAENVSIQSSSACATTGTTSQYTLAVSKSGTGSGTVTSSTGGISCGSTCSASYISGTSVTLTPSTSSGSTFAGWSGGGCLGTGTCTVTMDASKTVMATFTATSTPGTTPSTPTGAATSGVIGTLSGPGPVTPSSTVNMSWNTASGAVNYNLIVTDITSNTQALNYTLLGNTYTTALTAGHQYSWKVAACNATGCSTYTAAQYFQTPGTVAATPTVNLATPSTLTQGTGTQNVTITGSNFTSASYHYFSTDGQSSWYWPQIAPTFNNTNSMTVQVNTSSLTAGTVVYIKVCASNGSSICSPTSVPVTIQAAVAPIPTAPNPLAVSAASTFMSLAWNDNSSNETGFKVERKTGVSGIWSPIASVGQNIAAYLDYGVSVEVTYYYRVSAYNASGSSGYSNEASATITLADTTPPTINAFSVNPSTNIQGQSFTISYTVSDSGGSGLKQIGLWRANINGASNDSSWTQIGSPVPLSGSGPYSSAFYDAPPTVGNYWYGIHVIDNANPLVVVHESVPLSVTVTSGTSTPIERITNGSFTSGTSGWTLYGDFWAGTNLNRYYTSPGYASGGVDSAGAVKNYASGYMYQTVTIPSNATSATLSFQLNITSDETGSAYDYLYVEILNSSGALLTTPFTFSNVDKGPYCGATCTYSQKIANLFSFKGQTIRVKFRATTDNALSTVFRIDDVSLMADGN